ncbi:MAG: acetate--CoA ligase family protein, partial [Actinomycetota bacterium]|nr:acetate--CoA ligase family protein [Actinomycetota bacterium]
AVRALAAVTRYAEWRARPPGEVPESPDVCAERARALVERWLDERPEGGALDPARLTELLACYGVRLWPSIPAPDADTAVRVAAELGGPVVLKTTLEHLRHRPDLRDVRLGLQGEGQVRAAYQALKRELAASAPMIVQPMAAPGVAVVVSSLEDPLFGPVVSFGLGGVATELLGDRTYRIPPLTGTEAREMVRCVRAAPLLFGHGGSEPVDVAAVEDLLVRIGRLADDLPEVCELELNPVLVATSGLAVLHAGARLAPPLVRTDRGPRHLTD